MVELLPTLGVVLPENMGNRGQNVLSISDAFQRLALASMEVEFVGHHRRPSGNFVFRYRADAEIQKAASVAEEVLRLRCVARSFLHLEGVCANVPANAEVLRTSVVVRTQERLQRVVFVGLSEDVPVEHQVLGALTPKIELISWPSRRDVLCLYDRPGEAGDVGQVTRAVVKRIRRSRATPDLFGTGRALSVIHDLLAGRYVRAVSGARSS